MLRRNSKQRRGKSKFTDGFCISNGPIISQDNERERDVGEFDDVGLPRVHGASMLFAIARDPGTIFTCWSIDWPTIADAVEEKSVAVEPMAGYCYISVSRPRGSYHVGIGYYQPADVWHSVAVSADVSMPPEKVTEGVDVDLATIPFHVRFQRLLDLFGAANGDALATVISRFQTRALSSGRYEKLSPEQRKILRLGDVALSEIADARRAFNQIDSEKLARRTRALLGLGSISSSRGFEGDWASAGS